MPGSKVALVTGAGSGIGRATCQLFDRDGVTVVATDINGAAAEETVKSLSGKNHLSITMDISDDEQVQSVFKSLKARSVLPTMVVNCAGILKFNYFIDENLETFKRILDVNLGGTFSVVQNACKALIEAKSPGSIVAVSSLAATKAMPGLVSYAASKGGIVALTNTIALEMAKHNIRCNAVLPGPTNTPLQHTTTVTDETLQLAAAVPMRRRAEPEEIAELIVFLASDKSSYMTGGAIPISGGWH